jgi:undecaprenyl-phosphate 4-deoxy-4-formamido-L-arabinose transferase
LLVGSFGVCLLGIVLWGYIIGQTTVAGFTSVASMVALFSSAQMLSIGILGEYLGRIHSGGMGRPTYVVRTEINTTHSSTNSARLPGVPSQQS